MKTKRLPVISEILKVYKDSAEQYLAFKGDITRIKSLRPSQLPFCPVQFFYQNASHGAIRTMDMNGSFYTSVGTAVHTVVQDYLSRSGKFLASWRCKQCGKWKRVTMQHECCDFQMEYHEITIDHKGVVGHIDAVFKDKNGDYWILDFKTCSVLGYPEKPKRPGKVYTDQVEAYALMLWLQFGIKVRGVMLMFIRRDNPNEPGMWAKELDDEDFAKIKRRISRYKKMHKQAMAAATMEEAIALAKYGRCKNPYCKSCRSSISLKSRLKEAYKKGKMAKRLPLVDLVS
jgi:hypothetical protein